MYLPKSKYSSTKYTNGKDYVTKDGKYYTGPYFITYNDKFYTGNKPSKNAKELRRLDDKLIFANFVGEHIQPTSKDFERGYIVRYFSQDTRTKEVIETKKQRHVGLSQYNYIESLNFKWDLTQPAYDIVKEDYVYSGSITRNKNITIEADKQMKGISLILKDPSEFVITNKNRIL